MQIPSGLNGLRDFFVSEGFDIRFVGGAVRDHLRGIVPADIDLCTNANPDEQIAIYSKYGYDYYETGLAHGTISVMVEGELYEITSLRVEADHDGRHASVSYTTDWTLDQERRDLTINSMAMTFDGELIDPFGGREDLSNGIVRFVGDADARITEDYLRILRWLRFHARISPNSPLDKDTTQAVMKHAEGLSRISRERVWMEISKIITGLAPDLMFKAIYDMGLAPHIDLPQGDVREMILVTSKNPVTKLVGLLGEGVIPVTVSWKMSGAESSLARFLVAHRGRTDYKYLVCHDASPLHHVVELSHLNRDCIMAKKIQTGNYPIFPVKGADLLAAGFSSGPEMGKKLAALRKAWAASDFKASKAELLA